MLRVLSMNNKSASKNSNFSSKHFRKEVILFLGLIFLYFIAGKFSFQFAFDNPSATPVWFPTGISIAAFLIYKYRIWPAIFIGAFLLNLTTAGDIYTSIFIALGNMLEGLVAAYLINKYANGKKTFFSLRDIFKYILFAAVLSTTISVNIGVLTLISSGFAAWGDFFKLWFTWWLGNASGALIITPFIIFWRARHPVRSKDKAVETFSVFMSLLAVGYIAFGGFGVGILSDYPFEFLLIPIISWIVFRYGRRETMTAILILLMIAVLGTINGFGPFVRSSPSESLLRLQIFMSVVTITVLILAVAAAERRKAEERLKHTLDTMVEGFQIIDFDWRYIYLNNSMFTQIHLKEDEILGKKMMEVYPDIDKTELFARLEKCMYERTAHSMYNEFVFPDKTKRWFQLRIEPVAEGLLILSIDVTHERQLDLMKTEFISLASHELRTPVSLIKGYLSMIRNGDFGRLGESMKRPFAQMSSSTDRLVSLINDILDVSRIEAGRLNFYFEEVSLDSLIGKALAGQRLLVDGKKIKIKIIKSKEIFVKVDREKALQVLENIFANAIKFTDSGTITIRVEKEKNKAVVRITDTGRGVDKDDIPKLFGKFEQLRSAPLSEKPRTGLGLYISREFARRMNGELWVEKTEIGKGSTFSFSMPIAGSDKNKKVIKK